MSDGVEIVITNPIPPPAPDVPFDRAATQLAVGWHPSGDNTGIVYTASMTVRPYRYVGGVLDLAPESMTQVVNIGDVAQEIATGSAYGQVAGAILAILQQGLAGLGGTPEA